MRDGWRETAGRPIAFGTTALGLSLALFSGQSAHAAPSFDCAKASRPVEAVICGDARLSDLDAALAAVYGAKKTSLAEEARTALVHAQRDWVKEGERRCLGMVPNKPPLPADQTRAATDCLTARYQARLKVLESVQTGEARKREAESRIPNSYNPDKLVLLYSADDDLCLPLMKTYADLRVRADRESQESRDPYNSVWEDKFPAKFAKIGLKKADPIFSDQNPYFKAYYKIPLEDNAPSSIIYIEDISDRGVDFTTNVAISRNVNSIKWPDAPDNRDVDIGIIFGMNIRGYVETKKLPYYFNNNDIAKKFSYVHYDETYGYYVYKIDIGVSGESPVIQRLFVYKNNAIFVSREVRDILVYKISEERNVNDVCYMSYSVFEIGHAGEK